MKIRDILAEGRPTLSFEVFPPKTADAYESVEKAASKIAELKPDFMSVTYGAGGGTSEYTVKTASTIKEGVWCNTIGTSYLCFFNKRESTSCIGGIKGT